MTTGTTIKAKPAANPVGAQMEHMKEELAKVERDIARAKEVTPVPTVGFSNKHEQNPSNWNIYATEEEGVIHAVNTVTNRVFDGTTKELSALIRG